MASFFDDDDDSDDALSPARAGPSRVPAGPSYAASRSAPAAPRPGSPAASDDEAGGRAGPAYGGAGGRMEYELPAPDDGPPDPAPLAHDGEKETDVARLMRAWVGERSAPGLMRWEDDLVDGVMWRIEQQVRLSLQATRRAPGVASTDERRAAPEQTQREMVSLLLAEASTSEEEHFKLMLVQTEMERAKYLVRSYLRTRLAKVRVRAPGRAIVWPAANRPG
jgi:hypothetical protein